MKRHLHSNKKITLAALPGVIAGLNRVSPEKKTSISYNKTRRSKFGFSRFFIFHFFFCVIDIFLSVSPPPILISGKPAFHLITFLFPCCDKIFNSCFRKSPTSFLSPSLTRSYSHTYTLSHCISLSLIHTHLHAPLSLSLSLSLSVTRSPHPITAKTT